MFIDKATVKLKAGDGGRGMVSFRHEKYVDKGGPDGGDGGQGGSIIFIGDNNISTLLDFKYSYMIKAEDGGSGFRRHQHGKNGEDKLVYVPLGTQVFHNGELIADIKLKGQEEILAKGGQGGFGNAHFKTSTRQAPRVAEKGEPGQELEVQLELKTIAEVGLVGLPNAGKSTFLSVVTNAKPEIADYQFTTLKPNIGVVNSKSAGGILIADIPGLIEGAHEGKGLGDEFLKHIERTKVLLYLIDSTSEDITADYQTILNELKNYPKLNLAAKPQIVALTKIDLIDDEWLDYQKKQLSLVSKAKIYAISSSAHENLEDLLIAVGQAVKAQKQEEEKLAQEEDDGADEITTLSLSSEQNKDAWSVEKVGDHKFQISGPKVELFIRKTDFSNKFSVERLHDILSKQGIMHRLTKLGYEDGDQLTSSGIKFKL